MSLILDFFRDKIKHPDGLTFEESLGMPDSEWETCHNYVQWLFPLPEPSLLHPNSPVATEEDFAEFRKDPQLQLRLIHAVDRYEQFLWDCQRWIRRHDHNHLRITRVIRCLTLAGLPWKAEAFHDMVLGMASSGPVSIRSLGYWMEARNPNPAWLRGDGND